MEEKNMKMNEKQFKLLIMVTLLSILIFIPLIPIIIIGVGGIASWIYLLLKSISIWKGRRKIYMSVLGMEGAGKTTWYDYLRRENRASEGATSGEVEIGEFTIPYEDDKGTRELTIAKGLDISGARDSQSSYKDQIEKSDVIFFFFDVKKYLDNAEYQKDVHSRLDLIYDYIMEFNKKTNDVYLIASHKGKVKDPKKALKQVRDILSEKRYRDLVKYLICIEMRETKEVEYLKKRLIDKK